MHGTQGGFDHLAAQVAGKFVDDLELLGHALCDQRGVELGIAQGDPASGTSQATLLVPFTMHTRPGLHGMPAQGSIAPQPAEKR